MLAVLIQAVTVGWPNNGGRFSNKGLAGVDGGDKSNGYLSHFRCCAAELFGADIVLFSRIYYVRAG